MNPESVHERLESRAFPSVPRDGEPQAPHGPLQTLGAELVMEATPDGTRFHRVCARHQWASRGVLDLENAGRCPLCAMECEEQHGRLRYAAIHTRLVLGC